MMWRWGVFGALIVALGLLMPMGVALGGNTPTPTATANVFFQDDFATYSGRWQEQETPKASVIYRDDALVLRVVSPGASVWSVPDFALTLENYTLQTRVTVTADSDDAAVGYVFGYAEDAPFWAFLVSVRGDWQVLRRDEKAWRDVTPDDAEPIERDPQQTTLDLRADVCADTVTFWVDGQRVGVLQPDVEAWQGAGFGLIARAGHGRIEAAFDVISVRALAEEDESTDEDGSDFEVGERGRTD